MDRRKTNNAKVYRLTKIDGPKSRGTKQLAADFQIKRPRYLELANALRCD